MSLCSFFFCLQAATAQVGSIVGPYTFICTAKQAGKEVLIKAFVQKNNPDGTSEVLSRPYIIMNDGQIAEMDVSTTPDEKGRSASGVRIEVIKPLSQNQVLAMVSVLKDGAIVWVQATTLDVTRVPAAATQPAQP